MLVITPLNHRVFLKLKLKITVVDIQYRCLILGVVYRSAARHLQTSSERTVVYLLLNGDLKSTLNALAVLPSVLRPFASVEELGNIALHGIEEFRRRRHLLRNKHVNGCIQLLRFHEERREGKK